MATATKESDGTVRRKYGYSLPLLSNGLVADGEIIGMAQP